MEAKNKRTLKAAIGSFIMTLLFGTLLLLIPFPFNMVPLVLVIIAAGICLSHLIILLVEWEVDGSL